MSGSWNHVPIAVVRTREAFACVDAMALPLPRGIAWVTARYTVRSMKRQAPCSTGGTSTSS
jgi:hypothetical protein